MSHALDVESIDLADLAERMRELVGVVAEGSVVGRTICRDAVLQLLDCSQLEAENLVDTLIARNFIVKRITTADRPDEWLIAGSS